MAKLLSVSRKQRLPGYRGKVMIDVWRGTLRVRKWPNKRGKPKSAAQAYWVDWFRQANKLAKYADAASQVRAIEVTAGTGMYPRDYLLSLMRGRAHTWVTTKGERWFPMAAVLDISEALDVLAQQVGSVLVRATDRWRAPPAGSPGDVLTYAGALAPPTWQAPTGSGGGVAALARVTTNPTVPNGTFYAIPWQTEAYDIAGFCDFATQPTRFTNPGGFNYARLSGNVRWANNGTGERIVQASLNGASAVGSGWLRDPNSDGLVGQNFISGIMEWSSGDYLELKVYQSSGGNLQMENTGGQGTYACLEAW